MLREIVSEIQEYLRTLALYNPRLLPLSVDGFFGDETKRAVSFFQQEYNLPITGEVDIHTWMRLKNAYQILQDTAVLPLKVFADDAQILRPGETTPIVSFLKLIIAHLSERYGNLENVPMSDVYDAQTVENIREIQRLHNLEPSGVVDRDTWNILAQLYNNPNNQPIESER